MVAWPVPQVYGMAGYSKVHNAIAFSIGRVSDITMQLAVVRAMVNVQTLGIRQSGHNVKSTIAGSNRFPNLVVTICWSVERNVVILVAIAAYVKEKGGFSVRVNFVSAGAYGWVSNGKRRNGHHHSHNAGDCKGEKTLAEFLHNRFLQSERNLYRVCFGTFGFAGGSDFVLSGLFCLGAQTCIGNSHSDEAVKNHKKQAKRRNHATLPRLAVGGNCARANAV